MGHAAGANSTRERDFIEDAEGRRTKDITHFLRNWLTLDVLWFSPLHTVPFVDFFDVHRHRHITGGWAVFVAKKENRLDGEHLSPHHNANTDNNEAQKSSLRNLPGGFSANLILV